MRLVDLSHPLRAGEGAYPGLPQPVVRDHMTFEESATYYEPGTEFSIKVVELAANTATYLDTPAHRYRQGYDLGELPLERVAAVPGIGIDAPGPAIALEVPAGARGKAVLFRTGWSRHWGTAEYAAGGHPHLTPAAVESLLAARVAVVGIDSHNVDDTATGSRPAHTGLLGAGIPIVEHLTNLEALPHSGFTFFAVPPRFEGVGTFPVRAFALVADE